jgi:hypothetical protein
MFDFCTLFECDVAGTRGRIESREAGRRQGLEEN